MSNEQNLPGIGFRDAIGGREAFVLGHRVAVWEVLEVHRQTKSIFKTAIYFRWSPALVRYALAYAKTYPAAIRAQREREMLSKSVGKLTKSERLKIVAYAYAVDAFGSTEAAISWWNTGNPYLRGRKPSACAAGRVIKLIHRIDFNL